MIKVEHLTKKFKEKTIFENINCNLEAGKSYAIVGNSGAGKTTFLNVLSGLEEPTAGKVFIDDLLVNAKNQRKLYREDCGFVFQNFALIDTETVRQNLRLGLANQKLAKTEADAKMKAALSQVGLASIPLKQKIYTLSGGEQQRVALARVILKEPKELFADEPTGSLDADNGQIVLKTLLTGFDPTATVVIATHDPAVWQQCDYVIKIANKKITITNKEVYK
ncbi:ATP-binding cassette domain-containing protein [Lactobacillus sp. ESL0236]|uniref:ATP-binding cassette domain-containing protein n=1 Tax=unclassified Lactobacillus TaxID=2620435 RepID=UPI000EFADAE9|nr:MULTISPECIES: ATP-binding cassette domain-containing protein [unclassified Lactobacillus]RMC40736.1 ATP-binding cassette domain-containing protein [Lactobacillus sp. ESL0237]RMC44493.1 ATP-binding cassette domain-containing protein [Lactobacillus sp. ESL0234]RMC45800.1 ATP-binding cassette domain-containing protein [Lactobacillus sp. ESL0236]